MNNATDSPLHPVLCIYLWDSCPQTCSHSLFLLLKNFDPTQIKEFWASRNYNDLYNERQFLLQQCLEHWWFDIWQSYFPLCFSQGSTEHSKEDTTSADEDIFMCWNSFFVFSHQEVNVTGHLIGPHVAVTKLKVSTGLPIVNDWGCHTGRARVVSLKIKQIHKHDNIHSFKSIQRQNIEPINKGIDTSTCIIYYVSNKPCWY